MSATNRLYALRPFDCCRLRACVDVGPPMGWHHALGSLLRRFVLGRHRSQRNPRSHPRTHWQPGWRIGLAAGALAFLAARAAAGEISSSGTSPAGDVERPTSLHVQTSRASEAAEHDTFRIAPNSSLMFGRVDGFVQTPSGGQPGTTSAGRPTLDELGVDDVQILDLSVTVAWDDHELFVGGQWIELTGSSVLEQPLISEGEVFAAGSRVSADIAPNWYSVAYGHRFTHDLWKPGDRTITFTPSAGLGIFDIDYEVRGEGGAGAHRAYLKPSPLFGLGVDWHVAERLTLSASVRAAVPVSSGASLLAAQAQARYRFVDTRNASVEGVIGVGYEHLDYDDARKQEIPNHVDIELGPLIIVGLRARF